MADEVAPAADVTTGAAPAVGGEAPPTETSSAAPEAGAAPSGAQEAATSEAPETSEAQGGAAEQASPESDFSTPDSFDWDSWDGESYDAFDERVRPWAERFGQHYKGYYDKQLETDRAELQQIKEVYEQLLDGQVDPRLEELTEKTSKYETQIEELTQEADKYRQQYEELQNALEAMAEQEARELADRFKADNPDIFDGGEREKLLAELLDEDWDLDSIPEVMRLDEEIRDQVREAKREGVPDKYALKLAANWKPAPAKPRPAAELVSGASGPSPAPNIARKGKGDAKSLDDIRSFAIHKAMKRAG